MYGKSSITEAECLWVVKLDTVNLMSACGRKEKKRKERKREERRRKGREGRETKRKERKQKEKEKKKRRGCSQMFPLGHIFLQGTGESCHHALACI